MVFKRKRIVIGNTNNGFTYRSNCPIKIFFVRMKITYLFGVAISAPCGSGSHAILVTLTYVIWSVVYVHHLNRLQRQFRK